MYSKTQCIEFEEKANPHSWFLIADELHSQAKQIRNNWGTEKMTFVDAKGRRTTWDASNRLLFLTCGLALENSIKAFLVYENPSYISNGFLSDKLKSHKLEKLADKSSQIPFKYQGKYILSYFEEGIESWARYPCGINYAQTKKENILCDKKWSSYNWLISAYGKKLRKLLSKNWKGPHSFEGLYNITGEWLSS